MIIIKLNQNFLKAKILLDKMEIRYLYVCLFGGVCLICVVIGVICVYFSMKRKRMKLCEQREKLFVLKKKRGGRSNTS